VLSEWLFVRSVAAHSAAVGPRLLPTHLPACLPCVQEKRVVDEIAAYFKHDIPGERGSQWGSVGWVLAGRLPCLARHTGPPAHAATPATALVAMRYSYCHLALLQPCRTTTRTSLWMCCARRGSQTTDQPLAAARRRSSVASSMAAAAPALQRRRFEMIQDRLQCAVDSLRTQRCA